MKPSVAFLTCFLCVSCLFAQTKQDTSFVNKLNKQSWENRRIDARKAIQYGERAEKISRGIRYWEGLAYSQKNLGAIYSIAGNYPKARTYLNGALIRFSELNKYSEVGNIYNLYGLMYWETGKYDSALVNYDQALRFYKQVKDWEGVTIVYSNSGIIYYETGKLEKALSRYAKALDIAEKRRDYPTLANIHSNIGLVYKQLGDYPKALYHQKASIRFETKQQNPSGIAKSYTNIGVTFYDMQNPDSSLIYHQKALQIYEQIVEKKGISQSLVNIGSIHHDRRDFQEANKHYLRALPMKREMSDPLGEIIVLTHLGHLRMDQGQTREAIAFLDTAYRRAHLMKALQYEVETSKFLAQLHEQQGNTKKSMLYYKIHTAANERFLREQSNSKLTDVLVGMATKGKQRQISRLEKKVKTTYSKAFVTGSSILVLVSLLVFFLVRRHKKEKRRLNTELDSHTKALMDFTQQMIAKNAELQLLQEQLEGTSPEEATSGNSALSPERLETLNRLSSVRIVTDEDWETFKRLYSQVYPRFMIKMKESYSGITQAELRLAALITLQLSSKEIAAMLGISLESVKKSRQRLRKKMELTAEQDLDERLSVML